MQVAGARDVAVEFFTMCKSYNMAGWRIGFMVGNKDLVAALSRIKSYHDYGTFTPIQVASIAALEGPAGVRRRHIAVSISGAATCCARDCTKPVGWSKCPRHRCTCGRRFPSLSAQWARSNLRRSCWRDAKVAVSPGIGFGEYGDDYVRFALIENEHRTRQAMRGIKEMFREETDRSRGRAAAA